MGCLQHKKKIYYYHLSWVLCFFFANNRVLVVKNGTAEQPWDELSRIYTMLSTREALKQN